MSNVIRVPKAAVVRLGSIALLLYCCLIGIAGPEDDQIWNSAKGSKLPDGLMGWPIFAQANAVVRENVDYMKSH